MSDYAAEQSLERLMAVRDELIRGLQTDFWARVRTALHGQLTSRRNALCTLTIGGLDAAFEAARLQAEIGLLQLAMRLPDLLLSDVEADIRRLQEEDRAD